MKVRTSLFLLSAVFVILIVALGFIMLHTSDLVNREVRGSNTASNIIKDVSELNIVTYEYLLHHEERMHEQWLLKYDSLGKLLEGIRKEEIHPEHLSMLESITSDYESLGDLFSQLQANFAKRKRLIEENRPEAEINLSLALEERLTAQALMRSQKITSEAFGWSATVQQRIAQVQQRTNSIVLFSIIGFAIVSFSISFLTTRAITGPLGELVRSAEIIGKGNLKHRVDIKTKNEIGELAAAFNRMTERRQRTEEALRESERKLFQIVAGSSTPIFVIDKKHTVTHWNKACENLTGVPASEMIGTQKQWSPFYSVERPVMADVIVDELAGEGIARYYGGKYQRSALIEGAYEAEDFFPGCGNKWLFLTAAPLRDHQGKVIGAIETLQDITERKRAEGTLKEYSEHLEEMVEERTAQLNERVAQVEQLNQGMTNLLEDLQAANRSLERTTEKLAEVNQELNDFAYVVSHDLKAPLRAVTQLANWIATDYADALDQEGQEMVHLLIGRTKRMHNLIEGILQYSRIGRVTEKEKKVDLNRLVQEAIEMLAPPQDIQVIIKDELPTVAGERTRLGQVFQNLLGNAIKFMDRPEGWVSVGCVDEGSRWLFSVADNGPGIEEKYHARIFQMFQTLAPRDEFESTGVGLALVKKIVEKWGGRLWMESTVGEGSTFYFTLPKKEGEKDENR